MTTPLSGTAFHP